MDGVKFVGTKSVGAVNLAIGLALPALASTLLDLATRLSALGEQFTANANLIATPIDPLAMAASIQSAAANALLSITDLLASVPASLIDANLSLKVQIAGLEALRVSFQAIYDTLEGAASAGGVHLFSIDSTASAVGAQLSAVTAGGIAGGLPNARVYGFAALTELPATRTSMSKVFLIT